MDSTFKDSSLPCNCSVTAPNPCSSSNRYLGIWYHKVPEKTVVWVANRNDPIIGSSGFLFVNQDGNLVLYCNDDLKLAVWSTNVSVEENDSCEAQLLDSGNLIMVTKRSRSIIWQSFDHPKNTMLPGMKLGLDRKLGIDRFLTSWRSADDPGIGDFSLRINPNGSPQFFFYNGQKPLIMVLAWCQKGHSSVSSAVNLYSFHSHAAKNTRKSNVSHEKTMLAILVPSIASLWLLISLSVYLWLKKRAEKGEVQILIHEWKNNHVMSSSTITAATNNFSPANKLGQGGFDTVYKGLLANGQEVAVKRLSRSSGQGTDEFKNEVMVIAKLQHRNLVKLLGYCIQNEEHMLIYEYLPNKSLDWFLFDETRRLVLDWPKRFGTIVGIAHGILYLHQDSSGYMSLEYVVFGKFSIKSDVFSFGVMLLEILSGKKNNSFYQQNPPLTLIGYVWELWRQDKALEIVDPSRESLKCIRIGLRCVQEDAMDRPLMLAVVFMLSSEIDIPCPKQPAFQFR
uniref:non-specific serine/threonine protein kinase n=1 Tax=Salix viminalis TaxID=40686 RepID=A0A6N2MCS2_SALVM